MAGAIAPTATGAFSLTGVAVAFGLAAALHLTAQLILHYVVESSSEEIA